MQKKVLIIIVVVFFLSILIMADSTPIGNHGDIFDIDHYNVKSLLIFSIIWTIACGSLFLVFRKK